MRLKGIFAVVAVWSSQKQAFASVRHEGEGEKELLSQNSCLLVGFQQGSLAGSLLAAAMSHVLEFFQMTNE